MSRRSFLKLAGAASAALAAGRALGQAGMERPMPKVGPAAYKRIAAEEAWGTAELFREWKRVLDAKPADELGFVALWRNLDPTGNTGFTARLMDLGEGRLAAMDAAGIDMQILMLTAPGVQVFDADTGTALARDTNDRLAEACRNHPDRYAGCVAIAPQDPRPAALEIERGIQQLGLKGVIVNSHTKGEYLADQKYWEIFEAAEANDAPIYIHPREPSPEMVKPFIDYDLLRGDLGFGVEVAFHTQAIINAGVFDRFPNVKLVIGHGGEGIPYNLYRIDRTYAVRRPEQRSKEPPSYYMRRNVYITNSGVAWAPMVLFAQQVLGGERVLYAMDYPYQYDLEEVHAMDALPISYEDKKRFFQTNAERVFNLTRSSS
ncbi:MAG TPA: amidohydrolase family protein [Gammaproteobacteria bacterium]